MVKSELCYCDNFGLSDDCVQLFLVFLIWGQVASLKEKKQCPADYIQFFFLIAVRGDILLNENHEHWVNYLVLFQDVYVVFFFFGKRCL